MKNEKLQDALLELVFTEPFFTTLLRSITKIESKSIPTAGVTIKDNYPVLYWNENFLDTLSKQEKIGLLKHECYHLIFKHIIKRKHDPHLLWNISTDLAINSIIPENQLPKGGFIPGKRLEIPAGIPQKELEERIKVSDFIASLPPKKSSEWYMNRFLSNQDISDSLEEMMSQSGKGCQCSGKGEEKDSSPKDGSGCSHPGFDVHLDLEGSGNESELLDEVINKIVKDAVDITKKSKGWGSMPAEVVEQLLEIYSDTVDWKSVLKYFCGTKQRANKSSSFRRINRKYPYIHPGKKKSYTSNIAVYIDQSGSVSDAAIALFLGELNNLAKRVTFTVFYFDTLVDPDSKFVWKKNKKLPKLTRTRSGGTNFDAVETFHRKIMRDYDGYLVLTDGECYKPKPCKSKRCWVLLPGKDLYFQPDKRDTVVKMKFN